MTEDQKPADPAAEELGEAHKLADPAWGEKAPEDSHRSSITPVDQGCGVAEKDKKF